jgi:uncharacterized RmlC-like cupin family protein
MGTEAECRIVRPSGGYEGKQGLSYGAGVSAESAGASGLCLHTLVAPRVAAARPTCTSTTSRPST